MKKIIKWFISSVFFIFYFLFFIPEVKAQTVTVTASDTAICAGSSTTLTAHTSPLSTYSWVPASGLSCNTCSITIASPTTTTTYTIKVTNSTSITATATITITVIPKPIVAISSSAASSICSGRSVTLTASGGNSYTWNTNPVQTYKSIVVSPTTNTSYSVIVANSSGCSNSAFFTITVAPSPTVSVASTFTTICTELSSTTITATSTGASSYLWSPGGATSSSIVVGPTFNTSSTTYIVVVKNANGCTKMDSIHINIVANTLATPTVTPNLYAYCKGDSILPVTALYISTSNYVAWLNSSFSILSLNPLLFSPPDTALGTTVYYVVQGYISSTTECLSYPSSFSVTINPLPHVNAGNDIIICSGHTAHLNASGSGSYLWTPSTFLSDPVVANPSATPDSTISYQVIVTDANNCKAKDSVTVYVDANDSCGLHIYNVITPNGDGSNDIWWIDGINSFPDNTATIFNRWGDRVWIGNKYDNKKIVWHGQNESDQPLPAGTYYYVLDLKGKTLSGWVELMR